MILQKLMKLLRLLIKTVIMLTPIIAIIGGFLLAETASAQGTFSQCTDGREIARCETYDCVKGDTNGDGKCSLADEDARLVDARNDSFCAAPVSGCGVVQYYASGERATCAVLVQESINNCDLYSVDDPNFPSPTPTATPNVNGRGGTDTQCVSLIASVTNGKAPLTVNFEGKGSASSGSITRYKFDFGDGGNQSLLSTTRNTTTFRYTEPGTYKAVLTVVDNDGDEITGGDTCTRTITVTGTGTGGTTTKGGETLPETGSELWMGLAVVGLGGLGIFFYDKFKYIA